MAIEVRAADVQTALTAVAYTTPPIENGRWFDGVKGRFLEVRVRFQGSCPGNDFQTPELCDLRVYNAIADCNCDGVVDNFDIDPFALALTDPQAYQEQFPGVPFEIIGDCNEDGVFDNFDIDPFVELLTGP